MAHSVLNGSDKKSGEGEIENGFVSAALTGSIERCLVMTGLLAAAAHSVWPMFRRDKTGVDSELDEIRCRLESEFLRNPRFVGRNGLGA